MEIPDSRGETTVAAAAVASFDIVKSFNRMKERLPELIEKTRNSTIDALKASLHARSKGGTQFWGRGCLIFCNIHARGGGAWSPAQDFLLTAGRYLPRVQLFRQGDQPLALHLRNTELLTNFPLEQQARLEIMFNQWLQNGEQAAGYKQLQSVHALPCTNKFVDHKKSALELVRFEQGTGPNRAGTGPNDVSLELWNWIQKHTAQLFGESVRKGQLRKTYRPFSTMMSRYRRNRQGIYAPEEALPDGTHNHANCTESRY